MTHINVRVRLPDGKSITVPIESDAQINQLMHEIEKIAKISSFKQQLMIGYPPKPVNQSLHESLVQAGINQSTMVIVKERLIDPLTVSHQPDDNSCLFHAIAFALNDSSNASNNSINHNQSIDSANQSINHGQEITASQLRQEAVDTIISASQDPSSQLPPFIQSIDQLDRYIQAIRLSAWGGALEIACLSMKYNVEIVTINVEDLSIIPFNIYPSESQSIEQSINQSVNLRKRMYLLYSGIHYDTLYDQSINQRLFDVSSIDSSLIEARALMAADIERKAGNFTNTDSFTLMCSVCKTKLKGSIEANNHAQLTGHAEFQETK